jgi:hypothetical protein
VLMWRIHGRTHSRMFLAGIQAEFGLDPQLKNLEVTIWGVFIQPSFIFEGRDEE